MIAAARDCRAILLQYAPITERVVAALPDLGIVSRIGAGFDTVDTAGCAKHGIWVANSPDYGVGEVATHALALTLALIRNIVAYHRDIHSGNWHYLSSGTLRRASDMTLGHRRPRPHRQALGAHRAQRVPPGDRLRPLPHRRRLSGLRRARQPDRRLRAQRRRLAARAAHRGDARDDRRGGAGRDEARRFSRQHGARRGRRRRRGTRGARARHARGHRRSTCCRSSRCRRDRGSSTTRASFCRRTPRSIRSRPSASCAARRRRTSSPGSRAGARTTWSAPAAEGPEPAAARPEPMRRR